MRIILFLLIINLFISSHTAFCHDDDVLLDIPFVRDKENTWACANMAMMFKYYEPEITLDDVVQRAGYPPVLDYAAVNTWLGEKYKLKMARYDNRSLKDIFASIDNGYPVMVLQQFSLDQAVGSNRVVAGYNLTTEEVLVKEPRRPLFRMSFNEFEKLRDLLPEVCPGWPDRFFWSVSPLFLPGDVYLDVPFEPNHGLTCASSSMTMMLKFLGKDAAFDQVLDKAGLPPVIDYNAVDKWIKKRFGLRLIRYDNRSIGDIVTCIDAGFPAMVLQQFLPDQASGHNRVVIGYNSTIRELILHDPSELGYAYRMSYDTFNELWDLLPKVCPGWPGERFFWIVLEDGVESPLD